jgi:hypothetical protein
MPITKLVNLCLSGYQFLLIKNFLSVFCGIKPYCERWSAVAWQIHRPQSHDSVIHHSWSGQQGIIWCPLKLFWLILFLISDSVNWQINKLLKTSLQRPLYDEKQRYCEECWNYARYKFIIISALPSILFWCSGEHLHARHACLSQND